MSNSLRPHGLYSPWNSPGQNSGMGSLFLLQGIFPTQGSPTVQAHSLPAEPQGKPTNTGVGSLSLLQGIFSTQELNRGFLHYRQILCQLSHKRSPNFYWSKADLQSCINFRLQQSESVMHIDGSTFF